MRNVRVEGNLYVEGEVGISIGGNTDAPSRFTNCSLTDNVFIEIGRTQPTNRSLSWAIDVQDWQLGAVSGNLVLNATNPNVTDAYALHISRASGVLLSRNLAYNLHTRDALLMLNPGNTNLTVESNTLVDPDFGSVLGVLASRNVGSLTFANNTYFSASAPGSWFLVGGQRASLMQWDAAVDGTGSEKLAPRFLDATRSLEKYTATVGGGLPSFAAFVAAARQQSACAPRPAFGAAQVNAWLRAGFNPL